MGGENVHAAHGKEQPDGESEFEVVPTHPALVAPPLLPILLPALRLLLPAPTFCHIPQLILLPFCTERGHSHKLDIS